MARSSYIYLMVARNGAVLGAFTVKRELIETGRRVDAGAHDRRPEQIEVHRFVDGPAGAGRLPTLLGTLREVMDRYGS